MEIGPQLREIRLAADMSQRALAGRSGVANATISQIEAGHINPTVATLERILSGLSMDLTTFFGDGAADDASAAPRRSEKLLEDAIDSLNEGFVLFDAEDRLVTCNDVYQCPLNEIPKAALLARDIHTADGRLFMHAGAQLTPRAISILFDLQELGHPVDSIWVAK